MFRISIEIFRKSPIFTCLSEKIPVRKIPKNFDIGGMRNEILRSACPLFPDQILAKEKFDENLSNFVRNLGVWRMRQCPSQVPRNHVSQRMYYHISQRIRPGQNTIFDPAKVRKNPSRISQIPALG